MSVDGAYLDGSVEVPLLLSKLQQEILRLSLQGPRGLYGVVQDRSIKPQSLDVISFLYLEGKVLAVDIVGIESVLAGLIGSSVKIIRNSKFVASNG